MLSHFIRRVITILPVFILMTILVFLLVRMIPGDPIDVMYGTEGMDAARRAALSHELGLDQPIFIQYFKWLGKAATGDLGRSYRAQMPVMELILSRLPVTLFLSLGALLFSVIISIPLGILAAVRRNTWADMGALGFAIFGISMPNSGPGSVGINLCRSLEMAPLDRICFPNSEFWRIHKAPDLTGSHAGLVTGRHHHPVDAQLSARRIGGRLCAHCPE